MNKTVSNAIALSLSLLIVLASLEVLFWLGARGVFNKTKLLNVLYNRPFSAFQAEQVYSGKFEAAIKKLEKKEKRKKKNKAGWDRTNRITTEKTVAGEVTYTYNNQGIRGAKIFSLDPAPGITRIAAFGDSFIFGQCVSDDEYWAPFLTESFKGKTEVLNFGVNGYGTDQAFIKYREKGVKFKPDIVMIGLYLENVLRNVNMFRQMYINYGKAAVLPKPRFVLEKGKLKFIERVRPEKLHEVLSDFDNSRYSKYEYFYYKTFLDYFPFNLSYTSNFISYRLRNRRKSIKYALKPDAEPFITTVAIVEQFYKESIENHSIPFVLLIPPLRLIRTDFWNDFEAALKKKKIRFLNVAHAFLEHMKKHNKEWKYYIVPACNHFNELGNKIIAREIYRYLPQLKRIE